MRMINTKIETFHQLGNIDRIKDDAILDHIKDYGIDAEPRFDKKSKLWIIYARTTFAKIREILLKDGFI